MLVALLVVVLLLPQTGAAQEPLPAETPTAVIIGAPAELASPTPDLRPPTDTPVPYVAPTEDPFAAANATAAALANPGLVATPDMAATAITPDPNPVVIEVLPTPVEVTVEASSSGELPTSIPALPTFTPVPLPEVSSENERVISIGETLTSLAAQSNFSVSDLATLNALTNPNLLLAGQKLKLPAPLSSNIRLHRVAAGETLMALAAQYDVSPMLLRQANQLVCSTCLVVGQLLRVPTDSAVKIAGQTGGAITNLPAPFERISLNPFVPRQGDTLIVRVTSAVPLDSIAGTLMGHPLNFYEQEPNLYIGLMGVGALLEPSIYPISIRAIAKTGEASQVQGRIQVGQGNFPFETLNVSRDLAPLLDPQLNEAETEEFARIFSVFTPKQWWHGPMVQPIDTRFASYFGARRNFNNHTLDTYHSGVDMIARVGTPVMASAPGRVAAAVAFNIRGNVIVIDHGRGVFTVYCHLSRFVAKEGDMVDTGEVIGYSGNTGRVLGPHLHWELAVGGVLVNPLDWMNEEIP